MFRREGDRHFFRDCLGETAALRGVAIHSYVFMTNHVHLLVTAEREESLPRMFRSLGPRYVSYFNRHNDRTGSLWEDRYKSLLVDTDGYLLSCMRYIELNPVRAGMVGSPGTFIWSSYRANAHGREDSLVTPHRTFLALGREAGSRQTAYRRLFDDVADGAFAKKVRSALRKGWALGNDDFVAWAGRETGHLPRPRGRPRKELNGDSPHLLLETAGSCSPINGDCPHLIT